MHKYTCKIKGTISKGFVHLLQNLVLTHRHFLCNSPEMKCLAPLVVVLIAVCFPHCSKGMVTRKWRYPFYRTTQRYNVNSWPIRGKWLQPGYGFDNKFDDNVWPITRNGSKKDRLFKFDVWIHSIHIIE